MYDFINKHKRLLQIILAVLIVPPFALFGVDYYFRGSDSSDQVARVAGTRITQQEFGQALRQREEQLRQMLGGKADPSMLDNPQIRRAVLNQLWRVAQDIEHSDEALDFSYDTHPPRLSEQIGPGEDRENIVRQIRRACSPET